MKLVIIFGPQAVGKMTVGYELEKITDLKLFHNHMTIELVSPFFSFGSDEGKRLVRLFRQEIFEAVSKSDLGGLIFTVVWNFDQQGDWDYMDNLCKLFESQGGEVYFVELESDIDERIKRNKHPYRLHHKPTKRDIERSEKDLKESMQKHRLNSKIGEITKKEYLRINNTNISPEEVAQTIKKEFQL
jgi:hypothetical protein